MKKIISLLLVLIAILILTGCNNSKPKVIENNKPTTALPVVKEPESTIVKEPPISPPDLETEQGVREYLVGDWVCEIEYMSHIVANMTIHENLDLELSFYDSLTNEPVVDYQGDIMFRRLYRNQDDAPDIITLQLNEEPYIECDYYFFHRTIYDGKRAMSLFFAGLENSVFDIFMGDYGYKYTMGEVVFEKVTGEVTKEKPRKNNEFYAVFWGHGVHYESIWIDDVEWEPRYEGYNPNYPVPMIVHENEVKESVLYKVDENNKFDFLGDDMFKGNTYYVTTDERGYIVELIGAERKKFLEESSDEYQEKIRDEISILIEDIDEIQEYLDSGMSLLLTGEIIIIDDWECYEFALGTNHEENFVREIYYAVNLDLGIVYGYNVLDDIWEEKY